MEILSQSVLMNPSSEDFSKNKLFDLSDLKLNRDGTLLPFHRLKHELISINISINTPDLLLSGSIRAEKHHYYSLGMLDEGVSLPENNKIELKGFLIMEPPVVAPELYEALPELTRKFGKVYVHNTVGDGYSLAGVDQTRLEKLYWPQPYWGVLEKFWGRTKRLKRIVVINGNHKPKKLNHELYSKRIYAMAALFKFNKVDLYGRGWKRWWSRTSFWLPYWLHLSKLMSIYKGECESKYEVLSNYEYCLCFENMEMKGYVSEKIFDCFYAGTIPIYWGAPDISSLIPPKLFIDARQFSSWDELWKKVSSISDQNLQDMRNEARAFLTSDIFLKYYNSLVNIVEQ
ncbi:hypothetical protein G6713_01710 [Polynucleobacter paneuropaeus]|nr:hypothetical protein G6713_01710 [Polynucleobacter paneuropaeus]